MDQISRLLEIDVVLDLLIEEGETLSACDGIVILETQTQPRITVPAFFH